jgi:DNA-binding HxlR family transcriptional regulator
MGFSFAHKIYKLYFMDIDLLVKLTARAWSLPILALMHRGTPGRQAALLSATGAGRTAFTQSLHHLIALNLILRTPGHGHPLRPEYQLSATGIPAAAMADRVLLSSTPLPILRRSWTLPILAVSGTPLSFTAIKRNVGTITDRALSQTLKSLEDHNWLARDVSQHSSPPRAQYRAVNTGLRIHTAIGL